MRSSSVLLWLCALVRSSLAVSEVTMDAMQLIETRGYTGEQHEAVTEDGYLLTLHRIPRGRTSSATPGPPVLLQHGVLSASDLWVMTPPRKSLAFLLADQGYDVWLGNVRGNYYCRNNVNMSADKAAFWDFSFHEHGLLDLAAMINLVLEKSGTSQLYYVGHSMGATMFYVLASLRPQYGAKVRHMTALAPAVFLSHIRLPGLRLLIPRWQSASRLLDQLGVREMLPRTPEVLRLAEQLCADTSPLQPFCVALFIMAYGDDLPQLNKTALPVYVSHLISGGSKKTLAHFAQLAATGRFQLYDYGETDNMKRYGTSQPPEYPLHHVTTPCSIFYGEGDLLMSKTDMTQLQSRLPRAVDMFQVPHAKFNHIDFVLALDADKLVYKQVLQLMASY